MGEDEPNDSHLLSNKHQATGNPSIYAQTRTSSSSIRAFSSSRSSRRFLTFWISSCTRKPLRQCLVLVGMGLLLG